MNDPWDVKSVTQPGQYNSCMKINGVRLLPPLLSNQCKKEMRYYKLLAQEVEKRILFLKQYIKEDSDTEKPDKELDCDSTDKSKNSTTEDSSVDSENSQDNSYDKIPEKQPLSHLFQESQKVEIDFNSSVNEVNSQDIVKGTHLCLSQEPPERDMTNSSNNKILEFDYEAKTSLKNFKVTSNFKNLNKYGKAEKPTIHSPNKKETSSFLSKRFTGSLNNIYELSANEATVAPKLVRQRSYTLLQPSPQLLAHLEVQSQNTGVDMTSISMSESLSSLISPNKKRRSWDLDSAKVKWSTMALELKQKTFKKSSSPKNHVARSVTKKESWNFSTRAKSACTPDKPRRLMVSTKPVNKSEPIVRSRKPFSPLKNVPTQRAVKENPSNNPTNEAMEKETEANPITTKEDFDSPAKVSKPVRNSSPKQKCTLPHSPPQSRQDSKSEDPATRVRELYDKIQNQQLYQMTNLMEKQKREQMLLQQVFEEQNRLLFKQLKSICPESQIEVKQAWGDEAHEVPEVGPVSLSQLINLKTPEPGFDTVSTTLTETDNYLSKCENILKKSRDITDSIKNSPQRKARSRSPPFRPATATKRLVYDTSASTDREVEPILTDRTNDTLADLNVTFTTDNSDTNSGSITLKDRKEQNVFRSSSPVSLKDRSTNGCHYTSADSAISNMEAVIQKSIRSMSKRSVMNKTPTAKECAAATRIVAHAKGYLVRRLMRTARVVETVATIRDALVCALQLHQDREGIRGADVDLHRRLIQQITAACYNLHDTFISSTPAERCALIAADRAKKRQASKRTPRNSTDI